MPGGVGRRVQPFTVGTKLSVPSPARQADPPKMRRSSDDHCPSSSFSFLLCSPSQEVLHRAPAGHSSTAGSEQREEEEKEDERGFEADQTSASRSVRKITISTAREEHHGSTVGGQDEAGSTSESNANNNNNSSNRHKAKGRPEIVSVNSRYQVDCQFKVYLGSKDPEAGGDLQQSTTEKCFPHKHEGRPREEEGHFWSISMLSSKDSPPETQATIASTRGHETMDSTTADQDLSVSQMTAQYNRECMQAEAWIKGKLYDLKDGCDTEIHPLQDWDQLAQTLQLDLANFETHMAKLAKSGELLLWKQFSSSDTAKKQLQQLREQWEYLKQTAANQRMALAVAKELNDFHQKANILEAWIREQEERCREQVPLCKDSEKMHLTRRILELKQEEHENSKLFDQINSFAMNLEKRGRVSGGSVTYRRKQLQKMWLKVQAQLSEHHQDLQVALEGASFHQQAQSLLKTIAQRRARVNELDVDGDALRPTHGDIRDIASQIMMLDMSASQLSDLHPTMARCILPLQKEVKEHWAILQQVSELRSKKQGDWTETAGDDPTLTSHPESNSKLGQQLQRGAIRKHPVEAADDWDQGRMAEADGKYNPRSAGKPTGGEQGGKADPGRGWIRKQGSNINSELLADSSSNSRPPKQMGSETSRRRISTTQGQNFCRRAGKMLAWLKGHLTVMLDLPEIIDWDTLESAQKSHVALEGEILANSAGIEVIRSEGRNLIQDCCQPTSQVKEILGELERLWVELRRFHQDKEALLEETEKALKVLGELSDIEDFLQFAEATLSDSTPGSNVQMIRMILKELKLLETEMWSSSAKLQTLREKRHLFPRRNYFLLEKIEMKIEAADRRFNSLEIRLERRVADLKNSLAIAKLLQDMQQEMLESERDCWGPSSQVPSETKCSAKEVAVPREKLWNAMETVKQAGVEEREQIQREALDMKFLVTQVSDVAGRIEGLVSRTESLTTKVPDTEDNISRMELEPDSEELLDLLHQQEALQLATACVQEDAGEVRENNRLGEERPDLAEGLEWEIDGILQSNKDLAARKREQRSRLQQVSRLDTCHRNNLTMMSWPEETRSSIFPSSPWTARKDEEHQPKVKGLDCEDLDREIEQEFKELEDLTKMELKLAEEDLHVSVTVSPVQEDGNDSRAGYMLEVGLGGSTGLTGPGAQTGGTESPSDRLLAEMFMPSDNVLRSEITTRPRKHLQEVDSAEASSDPRTPEGPQPSPINPLFLTGQRSQALLGGTINLILNIGRKTNHRPQGRVAENSRRQEQIHRPSKSFWKRCQGFLGNTLGSLKRKGKAIQQGLEEASAYLQVNEQEEAKRAACQSCTLSHGFNTGSPQPRACSASKVSSLSFPVPCKTISNHTVSSVKRRGRREKLKDTSREVTWKVTIPCLDAGGTPVRQSNCLHNTWPLKTKTRALRSPSRCLGNCSDYVKNLLVEDRDEESVLGSCRTRGNLKWSGTGLTWTAPIPGYRTPDSTFLPDYPQHLDLKGNHGEAKCQYDCSSLKVTKAHGSIGGIRHLGKMAPGQPAALHQEPRHEGEKGELGQQSCKSKLIYPPSDMDPDHLKQQALVLTRDDRLQCSSSTESTDFTLNRLSGISALHKQIDNGWDKLTDQLNSPGAENGLAEEGELEEPGGCCSASSSETNQPSSETPGQLERPSSETPGQLERPSSETPGQLDRPSSETPGQLDGPSSETPGQLDRPSSSDSLQEISDDLFESQVYKCRDRLDLPIAQTHHLSKRETSCCTVADHMGCEAPSQWSQLRCRRPLLAVNGTGCPARRGEASLQETLTEMSDDLEVWQSACEDSADSNVSLMMFHPDHEQFEEDEQELEEIWNKSVCSNIMDTNYKKQLAKPSTEIQDSNPRKLYTTSAPNLHVPTELRLHSTSSQAKQDLEDKGTSSEMAGQNPNATRMFWAPDTHHTQTSQMASLYNETISVMAMTPSITEEKYVYRYGEEEEETSSQKESEQTMSQLSICVSDRVAENVSTLLHSARSNWAVAEPSELHPATRRHCGHTLEPSTDKSSPSEHCPNSTWDVQCPSQTSSQTMEGTLERKHILQVGGKKASCRTWNTFHTLLFRKTLLFYKDRKDTIKSSMAAAPVNLSGAVCTPATDYLKKTNSFRLQLRDGSEYLLCAASRPVMQEWIVKIQVNAGVGEKETFKPGHHQCPLQDHVLPSLMYSTQYSPPASNSNCSPLWISSKIQVAEFHHSVSPGSTGITRRSSVSTDSQKTHNKEQQQSSHCHTESGDNVCHQTMMPVFSVARDTDSSMDPSCYSVTLYIGERPSLLPRSRCQSLTSASSGPPEALRHIGSQTQILQIGQRDHGILPRAKNKSVFRKFFGKKE